MFFAYRRYWEYFKYIVKHKLYVFLAGIDLGIPLLALMHDNSKFLPSQFLPYARFFYEPDGSRRRRRDKTGYYKPVDTGDTNFDRAWFEHQKVSKHHWQYWVYPTDGAAEWRAIDMPEKYRREMLADWIGAGRAQGTNDVVGWYDKNKDKLVLHPGTRSWIEGEIWIKRFVRNQ